MLHVNLRVILFAFDLSDMLIVGWRAVDIFHMNGTIVSSEAENRIKLCCESLLESASNTSERFFNPSASDSHGVP